MIKKFSESEMPETEDDAEDEIDEEGNVIEKED